MEIDSGDPLDIDDAAADSLGGVRRVGRRKDR
jgi:hypothetical protein